MKKLLTIALTALFAVGTVGNVVGCKKDKEDTKKKETAAKKETEKK